LIQPRQNTESFEPFPNILNRYFVSAVVAKEDVEVAGCNLSLQRRSRYLVVPFGVGGLIHLADLRGEVRCKSLFTVKKRDPLAADVAFNPVESSLTPIFSLDVGYRRPT
jgi:hypothetical protein